MRETYDSGRRRDSAHRMNSPLPPLFFLPSFFPFFFVRSMALLRFRCGCWRVEKGKRDGPGENEGKCRLTNGSIDPPASRFFAFLLSSLASFGLILPREEGRQRKKPSKKKRKIGVNFYSDTLRKKKRIHRLTNRSIVAVYVCDPLAGRFVCARQWICLNRLLGDSRPNVRFFLLRNEKKCLLREICFR